MIKCPQCSITQANHVVCEICGYHFTAEDNIKFQKQKKSKQLLLCLCIPSLLVAILALVFYKDYKKFEIEKARLYSETKQIKSNTPDADVVSAGDPRGSGHDVQQKKQINSAQDKSTGRNAGVSSEAYQQAQIRQEKERRVRQAVEMLQASYVDCNKQNFNKPNPRLPMDAGAQIAFSISERRSCVTRNRQILIEMDDLLTSLQDNGPKIVAERKKLRELQRMQERIDQLENNASNLEFEMEQQKTQRQFDEIMRR